MKKYYKARKKLYITDFLRPNFLCYSFSKLAVVQPKTKSILQLFTKNTFVSKKIIIMKQNKQVKEEKKNIHIIIITQTHSDYYDMTILSTGIPSNKYNYDYCTKNLLAIE